MTVDEYLSELNKSKNERDILLLLNKFAGDMLRRVEELEEQIEMMKSRMPEAGYRIVSERDDDN